MEQIALYTRLNPGQEAAYEEFHRVVPSEIVEDLHARGVQDWRIWRRGLDLFHLVTVGNYEEFASSDPTNDTAAGWRDVVAPFLEINNEFAGSNTMRPVWALQDQVSRAVAAE
jgi:L-rhamnose mutarotase